MKITPPNGFWLETQLNQDMIQYLWSQISKANISIKNKLVGHISNSLALPDEKGLFNDYLLSQARHLDFIPLTGHTDFWVNFQKKYEFNPLHKHNRQLSFVIWMKIPYNYEDEKRTAGPTGLTETVQSGCFQLHYSDIFGQIRSVTYPLSSDNEGTMLMFPAQLAHQVYPFYTSDQERVSISGNIF
tara:strand:+ start:66 stop:623 length:558 start_codon:yes stop_codon:yes gene_type:complete